MESAAPRDDGCAGVSAAPAPGVGPHDAPTTGMDSLAAAAQLVSFCQTAAPNDVHSAPVPAAVPVAVPQPRLPMVPILDPIKLEAEQHTPPHTELISYPGLAAPADRSWTGEAEGWRAPVPTVPLLRCPAPALPGPGWGPPVPAREVFFADITTLQVAAGRPFLKPPTVGSKILDLYTLYTSVVRLGGMHRVAKKKLWKAVAAELRLPLTCTDYGFRLRRHYERYLLSYEQQQCGTVAPEAPPRREKKRKARSPPPLAGADGRPNPYSKRAYLYSTTASAGVLRPQGTHAIWA